jgi:hypothetical protein
MAKMKKTIIALSVLAVSITPAQAEYLYGFSNISANYLDWSDGTSDRASHLQNFSYIELEGGAGFTWGELYGFADLEIPDKNSSEVRTSIKGAIDVKTGLAGLNAYGQLYNTNSSGFTAQNSVLGLSYKFSGDWGFVKPWAGLHHSITTASWMDPAGFSGLNGGMAGITAVYNFGVFEQSFTLTTWNEVEFARTDDYTMVSGETDELSLNGAAAIWWNATNHLTTGIQYRYSHNKLGNSGYSNALIYSVKYNF